VANNVSSVVHAAANVTFFEAAEREPWKTNRNGVRNLLDACASLGIEDLHHVSTAFVCGRRQGPVAEADLDCGQSFRTDYEQSKFDAEVIVRNCAAVRSTIYRPSIIIGDSRTGYSSHFHGLTRIFALADRFAEPGNSTGRRFLPLRLPFRGDERKDVVPVDWVARAIVRILGRPEYHGRTFHLTAEKPATVRALCDVVKRDLRIDGLELLGNGPLPDPSELERVIEAGMREYSAYFDSDPTFDRRNTLDALPDLSVPAIDRDVLGRLVRFGVEDRWGRKSSVGSPAAKTCTEYLEDDFPVAVSQSILDGMALDLSLGIDVVGPGGGTWMSRIGPNRVVVMRRDSVRNAELVYRLSEATFHAVATGRESPQEAFYARRIEIDGDVETGLRLAAWFGRLLAEATAAGGQHAGRH
jgi:nucleoside-diphosphate-sugar epimerase